jgi:SAM-dependent methyltransferase/uncharacterized protein YbaR (Trm112 family)
VIFSGRRATNIALKPLKNMTNIHEEKFMQSQLKLSTEVQELLICPLCKTKLEPIGEDFVCRNTKCKTHFPIVNGIPVVINETSSIFSIDDFVSQRSTTFDLQNLQGSKLKEALKKLIPSISRDTKSKQNYDKFANLLLSQSTEPRILVVGGGILGIGMESLLSHHSIELIESDVSFGPRTTIICDAHDIPFEKNSFDGVIVQVVLEHVADPYKCVEEIHRVLKEDGLVYAETPFLQQVHMGRYDFTRFTHLGHRRLFRRFEEIDSGIVSGPGTVLAQSFQYFLMSLTKSKAIKKIINVFSRYLFFHLKYFDYLIDEASLIDGASCFYFIGKKSIHTLSDKELIKLYRGPM